MFNNEDDFTEFLIMLFLRKNGQKKPEELGRALKGFGIPELTTGRIAMQMWDSGEIHFTSDRYWAWGLDPHLVKYNPDFVSKFSWFDNALTRV